MKIGIVGDLHIAPIPEKRIDDYFQTGLDKIEEIASFCDWVIFTGDIFSRPKIDKELENRLIRHLSYCKERYKVLFATIIGNHDVSYEEEEYLKDSSLDTLSASKVMRIITPSNPLVIADKYIYRFNTIPVKFSNAKDYLSYMRYSNEIQLRLGETVDECIDILLIHHLYETGNDCFTYKDFKDLGCKHIFLGHDHKPFDKGRIIYPEFTIYRSGSIMRNRSDDYNLSRQLYYFILENGQVTCQAVSTKPAESVFKFESVAKLERHKEEYKESINKIIDKYENNVNKQNKFSIKNILEEIKTPSEYMPYIREKYEEQGESFV